MIIQIRNLMSISPGIELPYMYPSMVCNRADPSNERTPCRCPYIAGVLSSEGHFNDKQPNGSQNNAVLTSHQLVLSSEGPLYSTAPEGKGGRIHNNNNNGMKSKPDLLM